MRRRLKLEGHGARAEMRSAQGSVETLAPAKLRPSPIFIASRATALVALTENDNQKKRRAFSSMERRSPA
jgi:hypothetical protein